MSPTPRKARKRTIRSFVRRAGRLTPSQDRALRTLWPLYGVDYGPELIDFDVFMLYEYGVCQTRKRFIAGSPRLISRLRDRRDPSSHVRVCDLCPDRPEDALGIQGNSATNGKASSAKCRKAFQEARNKRSMEERVKPGGLTGAAPAVCSRGHLAWTREGGEVIRSLNTRELAALQSFPNDYIWPDKKAHAMPLLGNAVPPLFAMQMMLDYRL